MQIIKLTGTNEQDIINQTISTLQKGELVVFPTDTVYGLLADATNPTAIDKLLAFKERPAGKAVSIFVSGKNMAEEYVISNPNMANITKNLLPGPFTIVCRLKFETLKGENEKWEMSREVGMRSESKKISLTPTTHPRPTSHISSPPQIDSRLPAENGTLGFRIPDYPLILELVRQFGRPLTATSANISSTPPHYSIESFLKSLSKNKGKLWVMGCESGYQSREKSRDYEGAGEENNSPPQLTPDTQLTTHPHSNKIDLIVDAGKLPFNKPSTVIDTTSGELKTLRFGDLLPNTSKSLISRSEEESRKLAGFILSKSLKNPLGKPICFLLQGELGTGKTIFTKGLAEAVGIKETVVSPTYTLCYEYRIQSTIFPHLSTGSPIINDSLSDTKGQYHNIDYVEQKPNCRGRALPDPLLAGASCRAPTLLVHYDLYRIESPEDLKEIKFLESIKPGNLYSIEWPERVDEGTLSKLKEISQIVYIKIKHRSNCEREFSWSADC